MEGAWAAGLCLPLPSQPREADSGSLTSEFLAGADALSILGKDFVNFVELRGTLLKLRAEEEAVENVSGLLRLYDLRTKTRNRILTGRIMPMADAVEEKFPQACFPAHGESKVRREAESTALPAKSFVTIILVLSSFKRKKIAKGTIFVCGEKQDKNLIS